MTSFVFASLTFLALILMPVAAFAATAADHDTAALLANPASILCLVIFVLAYIAVLLEEKTDLRKSKPVLLGAGLIWIVISLMSQKANIDPDVVHEALGHSLKEYSSLMLFLLAAMTYITTLEERRVFDALRSRLVNLGLDMRQIFWVTGILAFFISPLADNLTTALVLGTVIMAVGGSNSRFITMACINIVSAANAGGAFSPFGDITTLMAWQAGKLPFFEFFSLFLPSIACFIVPAAIMSMFIPKEYLDKLGDNISMKRGSKVIIAMGLGTIATAISFEQFLHLPAFLGMMTGLSVLMIYCWWLRFQDPGDKLDMIEQLAKSEWDTLLFFYGIIFCVGGLAFIGYLGLVSDLMYTTLGPSMTNIAMGFASAIIDNIPVMFAILTMDPQMNDFQWLLITFTTGVGGSMLSIGSAAGVGLMGVAHGHYTFMSHLKWTPIILLGYVAGVGVHFLVNG